MISTAYIHNISIAKAVTIDGNIPVCACGVVELFVS